MPKGAIRVAIVDDDAWVRAGRGAAIDANEAVELVFSGDHGEAVQRETWDDVDVLLVDAHDPDAPFDHYAGVEVVERVRRRRPPDQLRIVVLTGHGANDLLRIRMAEAGADQLYAHRQVRTVEDLLAVTLGTAPAEPTDGNDARARAGLPASARINEAVAWASTHLDAESVNPGTPQKNLRVSRRRIITARHRIADSTGLSSPPTASSDRPIPTWREVAALLHRARGAERD